MGAHHAELEWSGAAKNPYVLFVRPQHPIYGRVLLNREMRSLNPGPWSFAIGTKLRFVSESHGEVLELVDPTTVAALFAKLQDAYSKLGLHPQANAQQIAQASRRYLRAHHPDVLKSDFEGTSFNEAHNLVRFVAWFNGL
jgi:hypothetical protein